MAQFVTIVVLLILAGITITYVMGDNSVFKQAQEAKLKTDIAKYQEMLETAKGPIIIQGLGKFDKDKYFESIENQGIINNKEKDIIDNEDGTYDITTKPGYVFLVSLIPTKENPTDAKIEYIGQAGKIKPIIKKIEVVATQTSITGKATVARLGTSGTVEYYCGLSTADEKDYSKMTLISNEEGAKLDLTPTEGATYRVKVVAKNEAGDVEDYAEVTIGVKAKTITLSKTAETMRPSEIVQLTATVLPENAESKEIEWSSSNPAVATVDQEGNVTAKASGTTNIKVKSKAVENIEATCKITVIVPVASITLNRVKANVEPNGTLQLTATVNPSNAANKNVTWKSSNDSIATVSSTGVVTGKADGTVTITATSEDDKTKTATCTINVTDESDWEEIAKVAELIAKDRSINNRYTQVTKDGMTIKVGQEFKVKYSSVTMKVRVLGFNHDTLTNPTSEYGSGAKSAGISFEFIEPINSLYMNESGQAGEGWAETYVKTSLDKEEVIGRISEACRINIKQVKKKYATDYEQTQITESNDKLWLLSCSEVWSKPKSDFSGTNYGSAKAKEGEQYKWYLDNEGNDPKDANPKIVKEAYGANHWWLRSRCYQSSWNFCLVGTKGDSVSQGAQYWSAVIPCFCI